MKRSVLIAAAAAVLLSFPGLARAASFTWNKTTTGTFGWNDQVNWGGGASGFPNAIDDVANLNVNFTAAETVNLNQTITVGTLNLGDNTTGFFATTISPAGGSLVMDVSAGNAAITKATAANTAVDTIAANILLNDDLTITNATTSTNATLVFSGTISGSGRAVTKTGVGMVRFVGSQLYDGVTTISSGSLQLGSGIAGGNGSIAGSIVNNSGLIFNNADAQSFSGANYSGSGRLFKTGAGTLSLTGGSWTAQSLYANTGTTTLAAGVTLSVGSGTNDSLYVGTGYNGVNNTGTLDLSGGGALTVNVGRLYVGVADHVTSSGGTGVGTLRLGASSNIRAGTTFVIGGSDPDGNLSALSAGTVTVVSGGTATIITPNMALGTTKSDGATPGGLFQLLGTNATLNLGSAAERTALTVGRKNGAPTNRNSNGRMDLSTGIGVLYLNQLNIGNNYGGTASGDPDCTGVMLISSAASNHLNVVGVSGTAAGVVRIGCSDGAANLLGTGTLTLGFLDSASVVESTDNGTAILLAQQTTGSTGRGTINFSGGTLTIKTTGTGIRGGGGASTLNLSGGATLKAGASSVDWIANLTTAALGAGGATIDTNGFNLGVSQAFSGTGGLTKAGSGSLALSGTSTYSGATTIGAGILAVNGQIASAVTAQSGGVLGGSGRITANIGGDGLIAPGNSPGILTVQGQVVPTVSTAFAFELSGTGAPTWSNASASVNDVLRLTNAAPFSSPLASTNVASVYFQVSSLTVGDSFQGGFFSDQTAISLDFDAAIGAPTFQYFVLGNGSGTNSYNGSSYYTLSEYITNFAPGLSIVRSVQTVQTANFSGGPAVTDGQVTQFIVVPEPATLALAAAGCVAAGVVIARRRRRAA